MKCPECNCDMEVGMLLTNARAYGHPQWFPKDTFLKKTFIPVTQKGTEEAGGVVLRQRKNCSDPTVPHIEAHICRKCKKLMVDYTD